MSTPTDHQKGRGGWGAACTHIPGQGGPWSLERVSARIAFKGTLTVKQVTARILQASIPEQKRARPWPMGEAGASLHQGLWAPWASATLNMLSKEAAYQTPQLCTQT